MNTKLLKGLIGLLAVDTALLVGTALLTSGLFFPTHLPFLSRSLLGLAAMAMPIAVAFLWKRARNRGL
jgi:hypothetical protein